jgi:2-polyprenyl-3-methyl-5-hydroxy-6-metoxy-1,4-benzoquinol methylase
MTEHGVRADDVELEHVYRRRFSERETRAKEAIWRELAGFLQRYVDGSRPVLDIACDRGYFIRNVSGSERWATDIRDVSAHLPDDVRFVQSSGLALTDVLPSAYFGTAFMSNYLEHLAHSTAVVEQLRIVRDLLQPGGRVVVLQPNIRLVGNAYWDFIDHHVALTDKSLEEAAQLAGLRTVELIPRFLPYTTKSRLPHHGALVRGYLRFRPLWRLLGKQTLFVGERP